MDLLELHRRTGIGLRRLRYCLDHGLIPGLHIDVAPGKAGRPRQFAEDVGFALVCAAVLLETGLPHEKTRGFLRGLLEITLGGKGPPVSALAAVLQREGPARGHLGDGVNVRIEAPDDGYDSGWVAPGNPAKLDKAYGPRVTVTLNLGRIRDEVFEAP